MTQKGVQLLNVLVDATSECTAEDGVEWTVRAYAFVVEKDLGRAGVVTVTNDL